MEASGSWEAPPKTEGCPGGPEEQRGRKEETGCRGDSEGRQTPTWSESLPLGQTQNDLGAGCSVTQLTQGWPLLGSPSSCKSTPLTKLHPVPKFEAGPPPQMPFPRDLGPGGGSLGCCVGEEQGFGESGQAPCPAATLATGTRWLITYHGSDDFTVTLDNQTSVP